MKPIDWRLARNVACLSLPTAVVVLMGAFFFVDRVPDIIRNEKRRVQAEYRELALELRNGTCTNGFPVTRGKTGPWSKDRKMAPGYWGTVPSGPQTLVWYVDEKDVCVARAVATIEEVDFPFIFWVCGSLVLLLLVGLTWVGIRYFVSYVKSRDDFMAATAHDLTTPLVGMRYMIGRNDREAKDLNERMIRLVENIKDFLRLGGRRAAPRLEKVDLVACYEEAYALFRADYRELFDGADVPLDGADRCVCVKADLTLTVQILWNLLGNDLKYAAPYGKVWVEIAEKDGFVDISFCDLGKGMTRREMRHAFDRYYRAKTVLQSGKGGFGIGLCTAREFARAMGGDLTVRANRPNGCVFTLRLPAMH